MFGTQCTPPSLSPLFAKVLMYFIQRFNCKLLVHDVMTAIVRERERETERQRQYTPASTLVCYAKYNVLRMQTIKINKRNGLGTWTKELTQKFGRHSSCEMSTLKTEQDGRWLNLSVSHQMAGFGISSDEALRTRYCSIS
jgi:hypothetical protein